MNDATEQTAPAVTDQERFLCAMLMAELAKRAEQWPGTLAQFAEHLRDLGESLTFPYDGEASEIVSTAAEWRTELQG